MMILILFPLLTCSVHLNTCRLYFRNCNVVLALLFGYFVAGVSNYNGEPYVDTSKIQSAPVVDFL